MSFRAMTWAAGVQTNTPTQKLILLLLADRASEEGTCYPSLNRIAFDACVSRQCVIENIKKLAAHGFISVQKRTIKSEESGNKHNKSNIYLLHVGAKMREGSQLGLPPKSEGVVNEVDHPSQRGLLGVVNEVDPNQSFEPIIESKTASKEATYSDFVDQFNKRTNRSFRTLGAKGKRQLNALIKDGYTVEEVLCAAEACSKDEWFQSAAHKKYLTPEFITRADKFQVYHQKEGGRNEGGHRSASV